MGREAANVTNGWAKGFTATMKGYPAVTPIPSNLRNLRNLQSLIKRRLSQPKKDAANLSDGAADSSDDDADADTSKDGAARSTDEDADAGVSEEGAARSTDEDADAGVSEEGAAHSTDEDADAGVSEEGAANSIEPEYGQDARRNEQETNAAQQLGEGDADAGVSDEGAANSTDEDADVNNLDTGGGHGAASGAHDRQDVQAVGRNDAKANRNNIMQRDAVATKRRISKHGVKDLDDFVRLRMIGIEGEFCFNS